MVVLPVPWVPHRPITYFIYHFPYIEAHITAQIAHAINTEMIIIPSNSYDMSRIKSRMNFIVLTLNCATIESEDILDLPAQSAYERALHFLQTLKHNLYRAAGKSASRNAGQP